MRHFLPLLAALPLIAPASPAVALCGTTGDPTQVSMSGDGLEKDTIGFTCDTVDVDQTGAIARWSSERIAVGATTGDDEKDTVGLASATLDAQ